MSDDNKDIKKTKIPIDIVSINCLTPDQSIKALDYSTNSLLFNNSFLFTDKKIESSRHKIINIEKFNDLDDYSNFMLTLNEYISSEHVLIVQDDGYVINPNLWSDEFLKYDYIGAPWPTAYSWRKRWSDKKYKNASKNSKKNRVGNGGFSLRSKKFLKYASNFESCNGIAEDVFLCLVNYDKAIENDIKFAPLEVALKFSYEVPLKGRKMKKEGKDQFLDKSKHFGWHGKRFVNSDELINLKDSV